MGKQRCRTCVAVRVVAVIISVALVFIVCDVPLAQAKNRLPFVNEPLIPASTAPGGPPFILTVNGTGFVSGAIVNWNGNPRATTFVSSSHLTATILATDIASGLTATITVVNPGPGGGVSNVAYFPVGKPAEVALTGTVYTSSASQGIYTSALVATGDVNNDGKIDVIEDLFFNPVYPGGGVVTFLGNGDGTLQNSIVSTGPCGDWPIALGDFNNDGKLDVVAIGLAPSGGAFCIMLGDGTGSFGPGEFISLGSGGYFGVSPAVGDFNGDGNLDVAIGHSAGDGSISVSLGNGDGTMQPAVEYRTGFGVGVTSAVAIGDFNRDGNLDLAVGGDGISVLYGNGDGTFQAPVRISPSGDFTALAIADFNDDGNLDIVGSGNSSVLAVLLGDGNGRFRPEVDYPLIYGTNCTVVADFNNDGTPDLGCNGSFPNLSVTYMASMFLGKENGIFEPELNFSGSLEPAFSAAGGDFNNDGHFDLVVGQYGGLASVAIYQETTARILPGVLTFPDQSIGTHKLLKTTLTNVGATTIDISGVTVTGLNANDFSAQTTCGTNLDAGGSCIATVVFTPTENTVERATMNILDNAVGSPQTVPLSGTGNVFLMTPATLNFGNVAVGQSSAPQTVTLKNTSRISADVGTISISGGAAIAFSETNNCPVFLRPGASCQIQLVFTPQAKGSSSSFLYSLSPNPTDLLGNGT